LSHFLLAASAAMLPPARPAFADRGSLGADGLFPDCDSNACVSSQDDRPQVWDPPWIFEDSLEESVKSLKRVITDRLGGTIEQSDDRYVRARFESRGLLNSVVVDDAEFFFAPNDTLVQFRASRQGEGGSDFGENRKRLERARLALGWEQVPVLRNRRRALVVVESPFDTFGPSRNERDELGFTPGEMVPAEIPRREIYGDLDPYAARWQAPSLGMRQRRAAELGKELRQFWEQESDDRVRSK